MVVGVCVCVCVCVNIPYGSITALVIDHYYVSYSIGTERNHASLHTYAITWLSKMASPLELYW